MGYLAAIECSRDTSYYRRERGQGGLCRRRTQTLHRQQRGELTAGSICATCSSASLWGPLWQRAGWSLQLSAFWRLPSPVGLSDRLRWIHAGALRAYQITLVGVRHGDFQGRRNCIFAGTLILEEIRVHIRDFQRLRRIVVDMQHRFLTKRPRLLLGILRRRQPIGE